MILCTGCGKKNDDESRFCEKCGKKLQSSRQPIVPSGPSNSPLTRFAHKGMPQERWHSLRRLMEAWAYLLVLLGVGGYCFYKEIWWPLYPAITVIGVLLWLRRI